MTSFIKISSGVWLPEGLKSVISYSSAMAYMTGQGYRPTRDITSCEIGLNGQKTNEWPYLTLKVHLALL